jgi:uncharacterized protein YijF (DUF1287 family)
MRLRSAVLWSCIFGASLVLARRVSVADPTPTSATATATVAATATATASATATATATASATPKERVLARAREEVTRAVSYDPSWYSISYPNGDVAPAIGVCTDVVIRGYRAAGVDFQKLVHEDVLRAPEAYKPWVKIPDATIDHRRVGPLMTYLRRHATRLSNDDEASYQAGDVVVISFNACPACSPQHVGIVSDKRGPRGLPLLIHNMGPTPREDDTLDAWTRIGHYRVSL